uniref:Uncharacterized protein n=1 Tax=Oryza sativa subsp. japonica TaxID=39947 RepID=Q69KS1_ORYSJ|nr:hypothetical protein [Oryza sativa Japonica Group]
MVGCEHMVLKVVLMTIKDRFANHKLAWAMALPFVQHGSLRGTRLKSGEKSVGVAGESMPLVFF